MKDLNLSSYSFFKLHTIVFNFFYMFVEIGTS